VYIEEMCAGGGIEREPVKRLADGPRKVIDPIIIYITVQHEPDCCGVYGSSFLSTYSQGLLSACE
jgi:hypothetical protein